MAGEAPPEGLNEFIGDVAAPATEQGGTANPIQPAVNTQLTSNAPIADATPEGLDEFLNSSAKEEKYGTPGQIAKTAGEGLLQGALGPIGTGLLRAAKVSPIETLNRQETNPITHYATEIGGLVTSTALGTGLGGALSKVGEAASIGAEGAGLEAFNTAMEAGKGLKEATAAKNAAMASYSLPAKIGSSVLKHAAENAAFQGQEEISKWILKDPNQDTDTAIADMGLSTLIGGAFGTIPPLWKATMGRKLGGFLGATADKLGGIEGITPTPFEEALTKAGVTSEEMPPEIRGLVSSDPAIQQAARELNQTDSTKAGREFQQAFGNFRNTLGGKVVEALGKTPEDVAKLGQIDKYEIGKSIGQSLADEYSAQIDPIAGKFENFKNKYKSLELLPASATEAGEKVPGTLDEIANKISKAALDEGWAASPSSDIMKEVRRTLDELPLQKNLKNLGDFITQVGHNTSSDPLNGPLRRAGGIMTRIMKDAEANVLTKTLGEKEGPEAVEAFTQARKEYAKLSDLKDSIDDRLHIRASTSGYAKALREMAQTDGEALLQRLSGSKDADWLNFVKDNYPKTAELIRNYHVDNLLKTAADKAGKDMLVDSATLLKNLQGNAMSPQLKSFIAQPEALAKVEAVAETLKHFENPNHNWSNTGRVADALKKYGLGTALGAIDWITGHGLIHSTIVGNLSKFVSHDAPDAIKLAWLKWLGSPNEINPSGFKSMVQMIDHTIKGENLTGKAVRNVFRSGVEVLPENGIPSEKERKQLKKAVEQVTKDPDGILAISGSAGHYMPEHATALSETGARAAQFIDQYRPNTAKTSPLDTKRPETPTEKASYNRMLDIAQQPLMVLKHIKEGTLTPEDVRVQKTLYPSLYNKLSEKIMDEVNTRTGKGEAIPYKTRLGLSLYLGQALDSTMTSAGILAAQPKRPMNQPQTAMQPASNPKHSTDALNKLPGMYKTPGQAAQERRNTNT